MAMRDRSIRYIPDLAYMVRDANNLDRQAEFWSQLLEVGIAGRIEQYVVLEPQSESGIRLSLQKVDEPKQGKNRMHIDLHVDDLEAATSRAVELGQPESTNSGGRPSCGGCSRIPRATSSASPPTSRPNIGSPMEHHTP